MTPDDVLAALDQEQRAVATTLSGPVCVLAGAGTGKTRAITSRIAYGVLAGVLDPRHVLAVTFTTRAAGEMRGRLRAFGVAGAQARTFHSAALRQLQYFWPRCVGGQLPPIAEHKVPLVREAAAGLRLPLDGATLRDLAAEVEWAKVTMTAPEEYAVAVARDARVPPAALDPPTVTRFLGDYERVKRDHNVIDFEDVLLLAVGLLAERTEAAEQVRGQYSSFVVDEYQDVSPLQQQLLDLWLGDRDEVCVVGDPSQTIYSFTGASARYLLDFGSRHPRAAQIRLVRNYRSTPQVVRLANALMRRAGPAGGRGVELVAAAPTGPSPEFQDYADEPAEAAGVAAAVRRLIERGVRPAEIAVLFRINAQSAAYEQALTDAKVPYLVRGAERFFDRREVRQAHLLLRGAARAGETGGDLVEDVRGVLSAIGFSSDPPAGGAARERWESLAALVALASDLVGARGDGERATLDDLVAELDERAAAQHVPAIQGVTLASLHAAKGLEWDAVFLVGLVDGLVPIVYAETPEAVEEERRLLYVGVTRARRHLSLSWAVAGGGRAGRRPSRFLAGLRPASHDGDTGGPAHGRRRRPKRELAACRACRRPLRTAVERKVGRCDTCPSAYDEDLLESLRAWRLTRAREDNVPAYVVFTDATLTAIAEARPATAGQLAAIPGVGPTKLDRYAEPVLRLCAVPAGHAVSERGAGRTGPSASGD